MDYAAWKRLFFTLMPQLYMEKGFDLAMPSMACHSDYRRLAKISNVVGLEAASAVSLPVALSVITEFFFKIAKRHMTHTPILYAG